LFGCAAFIGTLNGMARDRGPALIRDQAILAGISTDQMRRRLFVIYNIVQNVGHTLGSLAAALAAKIAASGRQAATTNRGVCPPALGGDAMLFAGQRDGECWPHGCESMPPQRATLRFGKFLAHGVRDLRFVRSGRL
jgi:hypothetical protein